ANNKRKDFETRESNRSLHIVRKDLRKLLLGEDMLGSVKRVCTDSIDQWGNLQETVFGHSLRLQPLSTEKKD
ncbi:unnamed protein product, partial [Brassica rapa]